MIRSILCLIAIFTAVGCGRDAAVVPNADTTTQPSGTSDPSQITEITLRSIASMGLTYRLTISSTGEAVFLPEDYSGYGERPKLGISEKKQLTPIQMGQIISQFQASRFFELQDSYKMGEAACPDHIEDGGQIILSATKDGKAKTVTWHNCYDDARKVYPRELREMLETIKTVVDIPKLY